MRSVINVRRRIAHILFRMMIGLMVLALNASMVGAIDELNWAFQSVGFQVNGSSGYQTAVAMRDNQVWPVVFGPNGGNLQAYSLYPVQNPTIPSTNWFQIGTNLIPMMSSNNFLSAATSPDGRFGAVVRPSGNMAGSAIVGASPSGFGAVMSNVQAIDFDKYGNLIKGTPTTAPPGMILPPPGLIDIAASPTGDIAIVDGTMRYYQKIAMAGVWGYMDLKSLGLPALVSDSMDLTIDSFGRPHLVGLSSSGPPSLLAYDFDVPTGQWKKQTLATNLMMSPPYGATIASDSRGRVGAAWIETDTASQYPSLMYAYKEGINDWVIQTVTNFVPGPNGQAFYLASVQGVGLAFDADNLPVISFTEQTGKIWLAYDPISPISSVPEPSVLMLLAGGTLSMLFVFRKSKICRR